MVPETDAEGAIQTAESVRAAVAQHRFGAAGGAHLTCSVGVACRPQDATDRDALLAAADHAMYVAKQLGRNQVIAAHDHIAAALVADTTHADREDQALLGTVEALAAIVNVRDRYTGQHSEHVAILSQHVALELGRDASEIHMIGLAARLHDIGKVAISDAILNKPGRLTIEEWRAIHEHPAIGADIAARIPLLRPASQLIRSHHERYDGTGYPDRLSGNEIPLGARIIGAVDAYNAMTTDRPYTPRRLSSEAINELRLSAGSQFDPEVVRELITVLATEAHQPRLATDPDAGPATGPRRAPHLPSSTPDHSQPAFETR
jgi:HD-GYP domain-containing protein (c-di-GMP phosphodiesterase class II)